MNSLKGASEKYSWSDFISDVTSGRRVFRGLTFFPENYDLASEDPELLFGYLRKNRRSMSRNPFDFSGSSMRYVKASELYLPHAVAYKADLTGAELAKANLKGANLRNAVLTEADLSFSNLGEADLTGADLSLTKLYHANLRGAKLRNTNLHKADMTLAKMEGADLMGANVDHTEFYLAKLMGVRGLDKLSHPEMAVWGRPNVTEVEKKIMDDYVFPKITHLVRKRKK